MEDKKIFEKKYDTHRGHIHMFYLRGTEGRFYRIAQMETDEYEYIHGVYCIKCGALKEYTEEEFNKLRFSPSFNPCGCSDTSFPELIEGNGSAQSMKKSQSIWEAIPRKLSIRTDEKGRILISTVSRNWKLNAKAQKPYHRDSQITVVVNTVSGLTYVLPAMWRGMPVFPGEEKPQTAVLAHNMILAYISKKYFENDKSAMRALRDEFLRLRPDATGGDIDSLIALARANYLGELYPYFHSNPDKPYLGISEVYEWTHLRRRLKKDKKTGLWTGKVTLDAGDYEYKFVCDGQYWDEGDNKVKHV